MAHRHDRWIRVYSDDDIRRIADAVSVSFEKVDSERRSLDNAATWLQIDDRTPTRMSPSAREKKAQAIVRAATRLLKTLGISERESAADGPNDPEFADFATMLAAASGGEAELRAAAQTIADIADWAIAASEFKMPYDTSSGRHGDTAVNSWVANLIPIYERITNRRIGTSVKGYSAGEGEKGKASGPSVRFMAAASRTTTITDMFERRGVRQNLDAWRTRVKAVILLSKKT